MLKKFTSILTISLLLIHCSDDKTHLLETPIFDFLSIPNTKIDTVKQAASVWEYGFRFKSKVDGNLSKLGLLLPDTGSFKVRLYNLTTNSLLVEKTIQSQIVNTENYIDISPIEIKAGNEFGVSLIADVFFNVRNLNGESFNFPITKGNISILSFNEEPCGVNGCPFFPSTSVSSLIAPCVNIGFTAN